MPMPGSDIGTATAVENKKNKYSGLFPARIENVWEPIDPRKLARVQIRVFSIHSEEQTKESLPWAYFTMPLGTRFNEGGMPPVRVGDYVLVSFMYSDPDYPVIISGLHFCPEEKPNLPHEIWDGDGDKKLGDGVEYKRVSDEPKPGKHEYFRPLLFTWHGVTAEIREDSSWGMTQREKGTSFFVDSDANFTIHGEKNCWISAKENSHVIIGKNAKTEIGENSVLTIGKNSTAKIGNDSSVSVGNNSFVQVTANSRLEVGGNESEKISGSMRVDVGSGYTKNVTGNYTKSISGNFQNAVSGNYQLSVGGGAAHSIAGQYSLNVGGATAIVSGGQVSIMSGSVASIRASMIFLN